MAFVLDGRKGNRGMTQDEIIEMAKQAGYSVDTFGFGIWDSAEFNRFAKLIAQHEREACAKACEEQYEYYGHDHVFAKAIRARGQA
jgi:hypothetical protein